jgi:[acyl-carrier-protein] S-malonyltransferase
MTVFAFAFPGQGSQAVGMGQALAEAFPCARHVFEEVDDALSQKLSKLMAEGPEDELTLTENAQPALMAVSMAALRVLQEEGGVDIAKTAAMVAGHSLGEYSALCGARAFTLPDTARLLKLRGQAMQRAVPPGEGAMAALLGVGLDVASDIAEEAAGDDGDVCQPANDNGPDQVVLSGSKAAIDRAVEIAPGKGARRAVPLSVSAPFHCSLLEPAAREMEEALSKINIAAPVVPLIANVTADAVEDPEIIRGLLVTQVTGMVRWRECVLAMKARGAETIVEIGSGKVLSGLNRRIDRDLVSMSVGDPEGVEAFLAAL